MFIGSAIYGQQLFTPLMVDRRYIHGDHSPDNVKFPDISMTVHGTPRCCWYLQFFSHVSSNGHEPLTALLYLIRLPMRQFPAE